VLATELLTVTQKHPSTVFLEENGRLYTSYCATVSQSLFSACANRTLPCFVLSWYLQDVPVHFMANLVKRRVPVSKRLLVVICQGEDQWPLSYNYGQVSWDKFALWRFCAHARREYNFTCLTSPPTSHTMLKTSTCHFTWFSTLYWMGMGEQQHVFKRIAALSSNFSCKIQIISYIT